MTFWEIVLSLVFMAIAYFIGIFGFSNIIGCIQNWHMRAVSMQLITIGIWVIIMSGAAALVYFVFTKYIIGFALGLIFAFVKVLSMGKIQ